MRLQEYEKSIFHGMMNVKPPYRGSQRLRALRFLLGKTPFSGCAAPAQRV
jgi:hypothetical protein